MTVRYGMIESGNDWWFAVDNFECGDVDGIIEFEDFESLTLLPFPDGGVGEPPGDGTDYTQDITNWMIDNDGFWDSELQMYTRSLEGAFDGWSCIDAQSWTNEQGSQQRTFLLESFFPERNQVLCADPDARDDYDEELEDGDPNKDKKEFNSFVYRTYDMSGYDNSTLNVEFDFETRLESSQRALAEVSFDGGASWTTILDADSDDEGKLAELIAFLYTDNNDDGIVNSGDVLASFAAPADWQFGDSDSTYPALNSNTMILRFGCIDAQNNWWFAVDNIRIQADTQAYKAGDANLDGNVTFSDLTGFSLALTSVQAYIDTYGVDPLIHLDFNYDGAITFSDLNGFSNALSGN